MQRYNILKRIGNCQTTRVISLKRKYCLSIKHKSNKFESKIQIEEYNIS